MVKPVGKSKSRELLLRTMTSVLIAPIFLAIYYFGGILLLATTLILTYIVSWEFYKISSGAGYSPFQITGSVAALVLVLAAYFDMDAPWVIVFAILITTPLWTYKAGPPTYTSIASWAITLAGILYSGGLLYHFVKLRNLPDGLTYGMIVLFGTWTADTLAYFIGKKLGRHKFVPHLSPNKTWEGAIGGLVCSFGVILMIGYFTNLNFLHSVALGILVPLAVISGDLTESFLKRSSGVKDASNLIPGHGGLLDRIDGLIFAIAITYYYVIFFIGG